MNIFLESKDGDFVNTNTVKMIRQYEDGSIHLIVDFSDESIELKSKTMKDVRNELNRHPLRKIVEDVIANHHRLLKTKA